MFETIGKITVGFLASVGLVLVIACFGLILAWPIKWTWNATMPYLFALPTITWGKAWCIHFLAGCLIKSSLSTSKPFGGQD